MSLIEKAVDQLARTNPAPSSTTPSAEAAGKNTGSDSLIERAMVSAAPMPSQPAKPCEWYPVQSGKNVRYIHEILAPRAWGRSVRGASLPARQP